MMVPDYALIAEISLFSFGFSDARVLAKKIVTTFKLSSEQLSSQVLTHYTLTIVAYHMSPGILEHCIKCNIWYFYRTTTTLVWELSSLSSRLPVTWRDSTQIWTRSVLPKLYYYLTEFRPFKPLAICQLMSVLLTLHVFYPEQELIVLRAIRDVNVPKFLVEDLKLFSGIVSDLFPNIK